MTRSKRDVLKRACAQAINHLMSAGMVLLEVAEQFDQHHPEDAQIMKGIVIHINQIVEGIAALTVKWWGLSPEELQTYL